ncbi:hypothetical protein [Pseudogracilibacillus sp. SO30301A]|uniref:hypothetical protein n=1 Tax=Pseudogracilibacillus sp. SO30301A TaxID=3098291 RepID=UPI00300E192C
MKKNSHKGRPLFRYRLPGENKQILLSGHRDTVLRQFGEPAHGDEFHVKMEHGTFIL